MRRSALSLPDEFRQFIRTKVSLEYDPKQCECGKVSLLRPRQHRLRPFTIFTDEMQQVYGDPRRGKGCYLVPAVSLVAACENHDPNGILVWIPKEKMFGTWDCDHHVMKVLTARHVRGDYACIEAATWNDIAADPVSYLNSQWGFNATISKLLVPWPKYRWVANR